MFSVSSQKGAPASGHVRFFDGRCRSSGGRFCSTIALGLLSLSSYCLNHQSRSTASAFALATATTSAENKRRSVSGLSTSCEAPPTSSKTRQSMEDGKVQGMRRKGPRLFSSNNPQSNDNEKEYEVQTWNPLRLLVLRLGLTEPAMTSPFNYGKYDGTFACAYCGQELFDSNAKYDSGSGWPSFWRSHSDGAISYKMEFDGRLECRCNRCQSHLGHVFLDGPTPEQVPQPVLKQSPKSDPRGTKTERLPRFCINGASMKFEPRD